DRRPGSPGEGVGRVRGLRQRPAPRSRPGRRLRGRAFRPQFRHRRRRHDAHRPQLRDPGGGHGPRHPPAAEPAALRRGTRAPVGDWALPLTAGFVAAFNPCGVVLLPAYVTYLLAAQPSPVAAPPAAGAESPPGTPPPGGSPPLLQGLLAGAGMTAGVVAVFGVVGAAAAGVSTAVMQAAPWLAVLVGAGLLVYGGLLLRSGGEAGAAL